MDRRTHSFRRVLRINDTHLKAWCRVCDGDTARSKTRARSFDSQADMIAWWREHEASPAHAKRVEPRALVKRRESMAEAEKQAALLRAIFQGR